MDKIRWKEYNRIFMEYKRCKHDSTHFKDFNNWRIRWRDVDENKLFTVHDKYYAKNWDNPVVLRKRKTRLIEKYLEYKKYRTLNNLRVVSYSVFTQRIRSGISFKELLNKEFTIWQPKKLTKEQILEWNKRHSNWEKWKDICESFNVSKCYFLTNKI